MHTNGNAARDDAAGLVGLSRGTRDPANVNYSVLVIVGAGGYRSFRLTPLSGSRFWLLPIVG